MPLIDLMTINCTDVPSPVLFNYFDAIDTKSTNCYSIWQYQHPMVAVRANDPTFSTLHRFVLLLDIPKYN